MNRANFAPLALPLVLLLIVLASAVAAVVYVEGLVESAESRLTAQTRQLSTARQRHANAGLEKDILQRFRETYDALETIGFVGAEQRINWVDGLRTINREAKLYGVEYQIGQQEPYAGASTLGVADLPMRQSIMRVRLPLLHEGDLMDFFRMLAARRSGVFTMNACEIDRIGQGVSDGSQPTLNAECELTWITVPEEEAERNRP
ncbi:MAG: hypothetical protein IPK20_03625 [Betaproteobacteria bacterium]|nr:hypothetical protein [Betaproteobacteria bacterium]